MFALTVLRFFMLDKVIELIRRILTSRKEALIYIPIDKD